MTSNPLNQFANIKELSEKTLVKSQAKEVYDAIILQTSFSSNAVGRPTIVSEKDTFIQKTCSLLDECSNRLKDGGLLFIYGLPNYLSFFGEYLNHKDNKEYYYLFKYWIACEFNCKNTTGSLPNAHIGLLMYLKSRSKKNPTPFNLNTKYVRAPYSECTACGRNTKDWGGKKHLLNPLGSALSDVWSFTDIPVTDADKIPDKITERILALLSEGKEVLKVNQESIEFPIKTIGTGNSEVYSSAGINKNEVIHQSCFDFLTKLYEKQPEGTFDLAFADPPYNLVKKYSTYEDDLEEKKYIAWCNEWLYGMYRNLKPGGALFVLNIPKWSIYHFDFLANKMIFRNWIVWDALSTPAGKFLPAHYALLYFTKPGDEPTINLDRDQYIDSREYCLRSSCINKRKAAGQDKKELLSDVWKDIHRIKHKKDRDHHPCQLPVKLMERIIRVFSNERDLIFDPFGGAGTTALASKILNRNYIITEIDPHYVNIAKRNLAAVKKDIFGNYYFERKPTTRNSQTTIPRKKIEDEYMNLCFQKQRVLTIEELETICPSTYNLVEQYQGNFNKLKGAARRKMQAQNMFLNNR